MNLNKFSVGNLPISLFKTSSRELSNNFIETSQKMFIVNATFFQMLAVKVFQAFLDPVTVAKQVFRDRTDPPELHDFVHKSQLQEVYGGTAPNVTNFWPPIMPPMTEPLEGPGDWIDRKDYVRFWNEHPTLRPMPQHMRMDMPRLPCDPVPEPPKPVKKVDEKQQQ